MSEIIISAIAFGVVSAILRAVLPYSERFTKWLINKLVHHVERRVKGSNMGAKKKEKVCKMARAFGLQTNEFLDDVIESTVEAMNGKSVSSKDELKQEIINQVSNGLESASTELKNKISK